MSPVVPLAKLSKPLCGLILAIYACFAVFGLAMHHASGGHWHAHGPTECVDHHHESSHSCHAHQTHSPLDSQHEHQDHTRISSKPAPCEGCQHWSSIVQASYMLAAIESVGCDPISEFAIAQNSLLHSDLLVAWNSRAPPVA